MVQLESMGNETRRKVNARNGASDNQFGVPMGGLRALAKKIKTDHALAIELWDTKNEDARFLAAMIMDPKQLTEGTVRTMVAENSFIFLADELIYSAVCLAPIALALRNEWIVSEDERIGRAGWALVIAELTDKKASDEGIERYLAVIERDMPSAPPLKQELMNRAFVEIAVHYPAYLGRVLALAEQLGVYRDKKMPKGCTSPYAPEWIAAVLKRKEKA